MKGQWKWHGAVLGQDGVLYGIPANATQVGDHCQNSSA